MSTGAHNRFDHETPAESAREDAELAALEAKRYPPFSRGQFALYFSFGLMWLSFGTWSLWSYDFEHRPFPVVPDFAVAAGLYFIGMGFLGRHLQKREDRKSGRK